MQNNKKRKYAHDYRGRIIHINALSKDDAKRKFYCISCGEEVKPVFGDADKSGFLHKKANKKCKSGEYVRNLTVEFLYKKFYSLEGLTFFYQRQIDCIKSDTCSIFDKRRCHSTKTTPFFVRKFYDTIREVTDIPGVDYLISSSKNPNIKPLQITVRTTPESKKEAMAHKQKTPHIVIVTESERDAQRFYYDNSSEEFYSVYGFNKSFKEEMDCQGAVTVSKRKQISVNRKKVYFNITDSGVEFSEAEITSTEPSIFRSSMQAIVLDWNSGGLQQSYTENYAYLLAHNQNPSIKACGLCKHHRHSGYRGTVELFNCSIKDENIPFKPQQLFASQCPFFEEDTIVTDNMNLLYKKGHEFYLGYKFK